MCKRCALGVFVIAAMAVLAALKNVGGKDETIELNSQDRPAVTCQNECADDDSLLQRPLDRHQEMPMNQVPTSASGDSRFSAPLAACFAPDTSFEYMEYIQSIVGELNSANYPNQSDDDASPRYQFSDGDRWSGGIGNPRALTWSFVPDGLSISSGTGEGTANSELFARMDSLFASQGGRATWIARIQACFDRWHQLSGVSYTRITVNGNDWDDGAQWGANGAAGLRGDVRICMKNIDGANGILAYNYFPSSGDMVLDGSENWASSSNLHRFLRNTVMHEHGHGLGFQHVCPVNGTILMEPFLSTGFDGIRQDDMRAGQRGYGDPHENNDTAATAFNLGTITGGSTVNTICTAPNPPAGTNDAICSTCSIDGASDVDFYAFNVSSSASATVVVTPIGNTYASNPQNSNCTGSTTVNSLTIANLNVQILGTNGSTVLGTAASAGAGSAETLSNVSLTGSPGTFYVRVYPGDSPTQSQLYTLSLSVTGQSTSGCSTCPGDANGDGKLDGKDIDAFSDCYLAGGGAGCSCADVNGSGTVSVTDRDLLIQMLISGNGSCP